MTCDDRIGELMSIMNREQDLVNYQVLKESVFKTRLGKRLFVSSKSGRINIINKINSEYILVHHNNTNSIDQGQVAKLSGASGKDIVDIANQYIDSEYLCLSTALRMSNRTTQENLEDMIEISDEFRGEQVNIERLKSMNSGILGMMVDIFINVYGYSNKEIEKLTGYSNEYIRLLGGVGCEMETVNRFFYGIKRLIQDKIRMSMDYVLEYQCGYIFVRENNQSSHFIVLREIAPNKVTRVGRLPEGVIEEVFDYFIKRHKAIEKGEHEIAIDGIEAKAKAIIEMNMIADN